MSLTIASYPDQIESENGYMGYGPCKDANFEVATSLVNDSSHSNVRIRADLYYKGAIMATKEIAKGTGNIAFNFGNILNTLVGPFKVTPGSTIGSEFKAPGSQSRTDLLSGLTWYQKNSNFSTFTQSTSQLTWATALGDHAYIDFTPEVGKVYALHVVEYKDNNSTRFKHNLGDSAWNDLYESDRELPMTPGVDDYNDTFMLLMPLDTGDGRINFESPAGSSGVAKFYLYALEDDDYNYMAPFSVRFTEYYEDASGDTQTGDDKLTKTIGYVNLTPEEGYDYDDYVHHLTAQRFVSEFANQAATLEIPVHEGKEAQIAFFCESAPLATYTKLYYSNGSSRSNSSNKYYIGIGLIILNDAVMKDHGTGADLAWVEIKAYAFKVVGTVSYFTTSAFRIAKELGCDEHKVTLEWEDRLGGLSYFTFEGDYDEDLKTEREFYKNEDYVRKPLEIRSTKGRKLVAYFQSEAVLEYLQELIRATKVWMTTDSERIEVTVITNQLPIRRKNAMMVTEIEIEYED